MSREERAAGIEPATVQPGTVKLIRSQVSQSLLVFDFGKARTKLKRPNRRIPHGKAAKLGLLSLLASYNFYRDNFTSSLLWRTSFLLSEIFCLSWRIAARS